MTSDPAARTPGLPATSGRATPVTHSAFAGAPPAAMVFALAPMLRRLLAPLAVLSFGATVAPAATPARPVSFNRDIRPIMSDTCFHCHGFDQKSRKAGMRLDLREEALKPTKNGVIPIVPGKPDESEIILRIEDSVDPMPPSDAHKVLSAKQKELLRRWVAEGAVYEPHWSYAALARPAVPSAKGTATLNPVDAFIRARLAEKKLAPSPEAPRAQLLRRLALDLTGLPPTPAEVAAFLADRSPNAYEKQGEVVDPCAVNSTVAPDFQKDPVDSDPDLMNRSHARQRAV